MRIFLIPDGKRVQISTGVVRADGVPVGSALYWATATSDVKTDEDGTVRRRFTDIEPSLGDFNDIWLNEEVEDNTADWVESLQNCYDSQPVTPKL